MLSPNPLSLFCAVLLCLPLALVFTISGDSSTTTTTDIPYSSSSNSSSAADTKATAGLIVTVTVPTTPISSTKNSSDIILIQRKPTNSTNPQKSIPANTPNIPAEHSLPLPLQTPQSSPDEDDSLLRTASKVNPKPSPPNSPKKVAFMFLTTTPLPFAPLWELFFRQAPRDRFNVYIHADPTFDYNPPFSGVFSGRVIPSSKPTRRHTPTLISAARRMLSHALLDDPANYMFALLSPACIPLHSFNFTYGTLVESRKSFIEILRNEKTAYGRWAARGEEVMLPEVGLEEFRIGSQFWSLTRRHARLVVGDRRLWGKFRLPCVRTDTCYPEENYFPTLLSMVDPGGVVPATLTHVDWSDVQSGHPRTYIASEVGSEMIARLRGERPRYGELTIGGWSGDDGEGKRWDPFLFARKFEPECADPLLSIANEAIFKD
ncbi:hypothetical protein Dimus_010254 [Dionaea muscipula]